MLRGIVCAALAAALCVPNAQAAPLPPAPTAVWLAERVSPTAPSVTLHAYYKWDRRGSRATYAAVKMVNGKPRPFDGITWDSPIGDGPTARHDGTVHGCPSGSGCDVLTGPGATYLGVTFPEKSAQPDRIYLAISGLSPEVYLDKSTRGWRLTKTTLRARYALSDRGDTSATGANVAGEHVEKFTHASLPGGRRGSIAVGTLPCRPLHRVGYLREGYGTAVLTGGSAPGSFDCQKNFTDVIAVADGPTTWNLDGEVVGTATGTTRITVIDL